MNRRFIVLSPVRPAERCYRQMNRRQDDIPAKKNRDPYIFKNSEKKYKNEKNS
jgi:hypothetical protein